ncbi:MAG TPA: TetR-like C-terminal domain-containing protein [Actinomycetes bacterium]
MRLALTAAALALLDESQNLATVTTRTVSARAGLSASAFFRYHATRADLVEFMAHVVDDQLGTVMSAAAAMTEDPYQRLRAVTVAHIRYALDHPARYGLLTGSHSPGRTPHCDRGLVSARRSYTCLVEAVGSCLRSGVLDQSSDVDTESLALLARVYGAITVVLRQQEPRGEAAVEWCSFIALSWIGALAGPSADSPCRDEGFGQRGTLSSNDRCQPDARPSLR